MALTAGLMYSLLLSADAVCNVGDQIYGVWGAVCTRC